MVVAPPFAYLHPASGGWQSLFALMTPVRDKSIKNAAHRDIPATACPQSTKFFTKHCAFFATVVG
jgi:hypothetical protein